MEQSTGYHMAISRSAGEPGWVSVRLRKQFWSAAAGSRSRLVAEAGFYARGMGEKEIIEGALRELLRAYVDDLG